jgi:hypothetical protein
VVGLGVRDGLQQQVDRTRDEYSASARLLELESLEMPPLSGEMFRTVFGNLNGVYTWECDHVPAEDTVRVALHLRVIRDLRHFRERGRNTDLAEWHGGWTREGTGLFAADIWSSSWSTRRRRHLGRACVKVWAPTHSGSQTWNGVAC